MLKMEEQVDRMKVFVSGSYEDRSIIQHVMKYLWARGIEVTHDWTRAMDKISSSLKSRQGIADADYFILVNGPRESCGKIWECGMADALGKPIICVGGMPLHSFAHRVFVHAPAPVDGEIGEIVVDCVIAVDMLSSLGDKNIFKVSEKMARSMPFSIEQVEKLCENVARKLLISNPDGGVLGDPDALLKYRGPT